MPGDTADRPRLAWVAGAAALACRGIPRGAPAPASKDRDDFARATVAGSQRRFPNPALSAHDGRTVHFYKDLVQGRFVFVSFAYTRCQGSCPVTVRALLAARSLIAARVGRAPDLLTLTLDPEHDTPEVMARYVAMHGSPAGWTCLTGRVEDLEALRQFFGFTDPDPRVDSDRSQHAALVAIGDDRSGRWQVASAFIGAEWIAELAIRSSLRHPAPGSTSAPHPQEEDALHRL